MKKSKKVILCVVALLFVGLAVWRLWPHSFKGIAGADPDDVAEAFCSLSVCDFEPGRPKVIYYKLDTTDPATLDGLVDILENCRYQQDLRNLKPGGPRVVHGGRRNYDGRTLSVYLRFEDRLEWFELNMLDRGSGLSMGDIVHPTDSGAFGRLADYIRENGRLEPPDASAIAALMMDGITESWEFAGMFI